MVTISAEKARLRDEAELAVMEWVAKGRVVTVLPQSFAPVCVPAPREVVDERVMARVRELLAA